MKTLIYIISILLFTGSAMAQPPGGKFDSEKAKTLKVGVYSRVLNLTTNEAKDFWPVYNGYETEMEKLREQKMEIHKQIRKGFDELSEREIESLVDKMIALKTDEVIIIQEFYKESKKVLPIKKVALLERAEREFKHELISRMRENRGGSKSGGRGR